MKHILPVIATLLSPFAVPVSQANEINIDVLSVQHHIYGGSFCCYSEPEENERFEYDETSTNIDTPLHFAYTPSPESMPYYGESEAYAGKFNLETYADHGGADAWAFAESVYTFQPTYSTLYIDAVFEGYIDGATGLDSWFRLTNLSTNEQLISKELNYDVWNYDQRIVQDAYDDKLFVNPENIYQLEMFAGLAVGQTGGYMNLDVDIASVPEPASIILLGAGLAGLGVTRKRKIGYIRVSQQQ